MRISDWSSDVCSSDLKIPSLKPAFASDGAITAASSASISDGAAALVLTRADVAEKLGLAREARIVAAAAHAHAPALFTKAPVLAIRTVLENAGWRSAERRGGKECVRKCRSRWPPYHDKTKKNDSPNIA